MRPDPKCTAVTAPQSGLVTAYQGLVEILSDSTEAYDRGKKFEHYRTIPSLKHYILIAQDRHSIDCYTSSADSSWNLMVCQELDGKIMLDAIDSELVGAEVYDKVAFAN